NTFLLRNSAATSQTHPTLTIRSPIIVMITPSSLLTKLSSAQKPFEEWTAKEVQGWLQEDTGFAKYTQQFAELDGKDLALFTKEDFLQVSPEMGAALYYAVQELKKSSLFLC